MQSFRHEARDPEPIDLIRIPCDWADELIPISDDDGPTCTNTSLLILEVEMRPALYDRTMYQELSSKEIAHTWDEVADAINADRNECIRLWSKLVKTFRQLHDTSTALLENWLFFEQMLFLLPYAKEDILVDFFEPIELKRSESVESAISITTAAHNDEVVPMKFDYVMDNEDLFLLSFAPSMTRMTTKQNALARIRILEELFKLEFEDA